PPPPSAAASCGRTGNRRERTWISGPSGVRTIRPPVAGTRLTQARTRIAGSGPDPGVLGVEQRGRPGDGDRHRIALAEVLDGELRPFLRVFRREVRHQEVLAD